MISVTNIIDAKFRGRAGGTFRGKARHMVKIVVEGIDSMQQLAASVERNGKPELAQQLRSARRFEFTLPADQWAQIEKETAA